jgi:hypothetical protein
VLGFGQLSLIYCLPSTAVTMQREEKDFCVCTQQDVRLVQGKEGMFLEHEA